MPQIEFAKMHGTGNDFVVFADFDELLNLDENAVRKLCDRNFGVGADGVIRISRKNGAYFMDYRNADGSIGDMCGNGIRTVGKWLGDRNLAHDEATVDTRSGVKTLQLRRSANGAVDSVRVDMGQPKSAVETVAIDTDFGTHEVSTVSMGNPHAVMFVDSVGVLEHLVVAGVGSALEKHPHFPAGTNVEFVVVGDNAALLRTWERGVGETLACGTGACATVVSSIATGRLQASTQPVKVEVLGGVLEIEWQEGQSVYMAGPAVEVFRGVINLDVSLSSETSNEA